MLFRSVFAQQLCEEPDGDDSARLSRAFRRALQRDPTIAERDILMQLLTEQRRAYQEEPSAAGLLLSVGQSKPKGDAIELAAWTAVTRSILNLHEFLNRP